jgi:Fungal protein kinase
MIISEPIPIRPKALHFIDVINTATLSNRSSLGLDPTIHICTHLCCAAPHDDLPEMPVEATGWVKDDIGDMYWIMAMLWKSRGLFSRGTVCYRVRSKHGIEYALKDCWVDAGSLDYEVTLLQAIHGVPNVVQLVKYWDVKFSG